MYVTVPCFALQIFLVSEEKLPHKPARGHFPHFHKKQNCVSDTILSYHIHCGLAILFALIHKTLINKEIPARKGQDFCVLLQFITL